MRQILLLLAFIVAAPIKAQEVKSDAYSLMLKVLLAHSVPEKSVSEISNKEGQVWLDARTLKEFQVSKIENAQWVGFDDFSLRRVSHINKHDEIIVYCSVGYRSEKVAEKLINAGYMHVSNLYGGIFEWKNQGLQVVDSTNSPTEQVHAYDPIWSIWLTKGEKTFN